MDGRSSTGAQPVGVGAQPLGAFYYSSLQTALVYWQVSPAIAASLLPPGLSPGVFDGMALVNLNFERYATVGGTFDGIVNEVEINVVAYPTSAASSVYLLTTMEFLAGDDSAKLYGNYRVIVPCDSAAAISGGEKYGENKYAAVFSWNNVHYNVPGINSPSTTTWTIPCWSPTGDQLFTLQIGQLQATPAPTPLSPIPDWATLTDDNGVTHLVQSARNIYGVFTTWTNLNADKTALQPLTGITLQIGNVPGNPVVGILEKMFAQNPPALAVCTYESPPAACSTHTLLTAPLV